MTDILQNHGTTSEASDVVGYLLAMLVCLDWIYNTPLNNYRTSFFLIVIYRMHYMQICM